MWHHVLTKGHKGRYAFLPSSPRCWICRQPFGGFGRVLRPVIGYGPSRMNPSVCNVCEERMPVGGAEVDIAVIFADVRGSTAVGERVGPTRFAQMLNGFYKAATDVFLSEHCLLNKMVGDEIVALYLPVSRPDYRGAAARSAVAFMQALRYGGDSEPLLPVGASVHCGPAYVGKLGSGGVTDFTAVGDTMNTGARLQALARPGELLMSEEIHQEIADVYPELDRRDVELKGKEAPMSVRVWRSS